MKHLNELLQRYKIKDSIITKKYQKYYDKYKDCKLKEENNQLIYEVVFFYFCSGIDFKYNNLQTEYGIKSKIFQTAMVHIKKDMEEIGAVAENEENETNVCNLYAITKNVDDYRINK